MSQKRITTITKSKTITWEQKRQTDMLFLGIDEEYAIEWWRKYYGTIEAMLTQYCGLEMCVVNTLAYNFVPVKSKKYVILTDIKEFVEKELNENGLSIKITNKKLKEYLKEIGHKPVEGTNGNTWQMVRYYNGGGWC